MSVNQEPCTEPGVRRVEKLTLLQKPSFLPSPPEFDAARFVRLHVF